MLNVSKKLRILLKSILSLQMGKVNTDKGMLMWDGDEDLKIGDEVFVEGENEPIAAPDGEYVIEDGKTIIVAGGLVAEIRDDSAEVADETVEETVEESSEDVNLDENPNVEPADAPEAEEEEQEQDINDRISAIENRIEEFVAGLNQIINSIASLEQRLSEAEGKLAKVEEPAAEPIDDAPEVEEHKTRLSYLRK